MFKRFPDLKKALQAALIAITANTVALKVATLFHFKAESGGLLKLMLLQIRAYFGPRLLLYFKKKIFSLFLHYLAALQ